MAEAGRRFLAHKQTLGLKRSTLMDYESTIRVHLVPFFGSIPLEEVELEMVEAFMAAKRSEGKALKSVQNYTVVLHAIFVQGVRRGWCSRNPVAAVEKPRVRPTDPDIRFLTNDELEALIAAVPNDELGQTERVIYLTAAMTGLRRGELLALRWQDVDTSAGLIRVRRNYTRGEFGTPKTRRSSRTVPLAERVRVELARHRDGSGCAGGPDLVFCHPVTGGVYDPSRLRIDDTMLALARGGVTIRGVLDPGQARQGWAAPKWLQHPNIELRVPRKEGVLATLRKVHHKLMVIDNRIVIAGSFNYTAPANEYNDENLFVIGSPHEEVEGITVEVDPVRDIATYVRAEIERIFALSEPFVPT